MKPCRSTQLALVASAALVACGDGGGVDPDTSTTTDSTTTTATNSTDSTSSTNSTTSTTTTTVTTLEGSVQKGPFIIGSTIVVSVVDALGNPLGDTYSTSTLDDRGSFSVSLPTQAPVSIEGHGYYWDELRERVSSAPIALRAWYDPADHAGEPAFVNLVTHLAYLRVKTLLADTSANPAYTIHSATAQAEQELVTGLGLGPAGLDLGPGTGLDLTGSDTTDDAYALALSLLLLDAAQLQAGPGGDPEGFLQQLLNTIESDLAPDGSLNLVSSVLLQNAQHDVNVPRAKTQIAKRLAAIDPARDLTLDPPPDIDRILDSDLDGLMNIDDNCVRVTNALQTDTDGDGVGDACDHQFRSLAMGWVGPPSCTGLCTNICAIHAAGSSRPEGQVSCWYPEQGMPSPWHEFGGVSGFVDLNDSLDGPSFRAVREVSVGPSRCVAFADNGQLFCWGAAGSLPPSTTNWAELRAGTCAVHVSAGNQTGPFTCWGPTAFTPPVSEASAVFQTLLPKGTDVCTLTLAGDVQCWNMLAAPGSRLLPKDASVDTSARFSRLAYSGSQDFCGLTKTTGDVVCWDTAATVNNWNIHWSGAALKEYAGSSYDCGLKSAGGAIACRNLPSSPTATLPVPARPGFSSLVTGLLRDSSPGAPYTPLSCALDAQGRIECWTFDDEPLAWR